MSAGSARLLLTGFEPFGGDRFNPSGALAAALEGAVIGANVRIVSAVLPVSGPAAWQKIAGIIRRRQPRWTVAMGVSGRPEISVESTAWNVADYRIPDNSGLQPVGNRILKYGPGKLASRLPVLEIAAAMGNTEIPVRASTDPGRFVCNWLYYRLLHLTRKPAHGAEGRAVFLHLPATREMGGNRPARRALFDLADLRRVVEGVLREVVQCG